MFLLEIDFALRSHASLVPHHKYVTTSTKMISNLREQLSTNDKEENSKRKYIFFISKLHTPKYKVTRKNVYMSNIQNNINQTIF
jgi:hypothetical protein